MTKHTDKIAETCYRFAYIHFNTKVEYKEFVQEIADIFEEEAKETIKKQTFPINKEKFEFNPKQFIKKAGYQE